MIAKSYPSDLTDGQWEIINPLLPNEKPGGRHRSADLRLVIDALLYMNKTACHWRYLPEKFPPRSTVFEYFTAWREDGTWDKVMGALREQVRIKAGRNAEPSASIIDSQTVKTAGQAAKNTVGYDGNKKNQRAQTAYCG